MTMHAGVVGHPIAHSLSPLIHRAWITAAGLDADYGRFDVEPSEFGAFVEQSRGGQTLVGVNVTLPHKRSALAHSDRATVAADKAGAANVLLFRGDGSIEADNTDGAGLIFALNRAGFTDFSQPIVVIGAGGAAAGALQALIAQGAQKIDLLNRTPLNGRDLAERFSIGPVRPLDEMAQVFPGAMLVINTTSATTTIGPPLDMPIDRLHKGAVVMDMEYTRDASALLKAALAHGLGVATGLDMLIGQAIPSFEAFFGEAPDPAVEVRSLALRTLDQIP